MSGQSVDVQCMVSNPKSLIDVRDGNLTIRKNGLPLPGYSLNPNNTYDLISFQLTITKNVL